MTWYGFDLSGSIQGQLAGSCKNGSEIVVFVNCGEFYD